MISITAFKKPTYCFMSLLDFKNTNRLLWILIICGFILYANTLGHDFNLDDGYYTAGNRVTEKGLTSIPEIFSNPTLFGPKGIGYDYRPVTAATFILQHQLLGTGPGAGHFINILIYLLTVVLLFKLLLRWINRPDAAALAFWICLVFLVHPLHTEVVASIKSRDELLALLFSLLSLRFWVAFLEKRKWYYVLTGVVFFALALYSKYTILPFLIYIPLALYFFHGARLDRTLLVFFILLFTGIGCHLIKSAILPPGDHYFSITENGLAAKEFGLQHRSATSFYIMGWYLLLHLFPLKLVYYYGYQYVPVVGWTNIPACLSLFFHAGLVVWCILNFRKRSVLLFGILWYLGHVIIYSNLVELAPGMMAERFAYVASIGFCMALVLLLYKAGERLIGRIKLPNPAISLFILVIIFGARTIIRNKDWENKETLYAHDVKVAPQSAMVNYLYGDWLLASSLREKQNALAFNRYSPELDRQIKQRIGQSQLYFNRTLKINPFDTLAQYNLASAYIQLDDFQNAEKVLTGTVKQSPGYPEAWFTLGLSRVYQKKYTEAIPNFKKLLELDRNFVIGYEQLNRAQLAARDTVSALATLDSAILHNPTSPVPLAEMANYWLQVKDTARAIQFAEKAAQLPPANQGLLLFLKNYFLGKGDQQRAAYYHNRALNATDL